MSRSVGSNHTIVSDCNDHVVFCPNYRKKVKKVKKMLLPRGEYAAYLRKSRMDLEAEARGEEDTYKRHMQILIDLAKRHNINISKIYREKPATSGERISERPEMIKLLEDVESQHWTGVLVVEVERLARGDTLDQGLVAQAFKYSSTLIITPMRIYDPTNSDDEEYFEFGLFMSRREFKTINRRLQSGRISAIRDGRYVSSKAPYGYNRIKLPGKGYSLEPIPEQAEIIKLIFTMYTNPDPSKRAGTARIARYLNERKIPSATGGIWTVSSLTTILRNPVYCGMVKWGSRPLVKKRELKSRPRKPVEEWTLVKGLHTPLIDEETFDLALQRLKENTYSPPPNGIIKNPLAGLVRCDMCGASMVYRKRGTRVVVETLLCPNAECKNISSAYSLVEDRLLVSLKEWLHSYKAKWEETQPSAETSNNSLISTLGEIVNKLKKKLDTLNKQKEEIYSLLEQKVYTVDVFLERSQSIMTQIKEVESAINKAEQEIKTEQLRSNARHLTIPAVENVLDMYYQTDDAAQKNMLLKSVIEKCTYRKEKKGGRWDTSARQAFTLIVYPRIPKGE